MAGTLPLALGDRGADVLVVMPRYRGLAGGVKKLSKHVSITFIENENYFNRASLYGNPSGDYSDNLKRFSFFCQEALAAAHRMHFQPDIVHANDWQTALLPAFLKTKYAQDPFFKKTKTLLTVHNLAYQGHFPHRHYAELGLDDGLFSVEGFEFYGKINVLKAGLVFADEISTVSPTYATEITTKEYGFGLEGVIRKRKDRLRGILNGIDEAHWDPSKDHLIRKKFSPKHPAGKKVCKIDLQRRCGLEPLPDVPVFSMVTRLAEQKGLDIFLEIAESLLSRTAQLLLLGEGDAVYQTAFRNLAARHPGKVSAEIGYDSEQAHRIYAGADFFMMPSLFEPCGLGQMISLRYGTIPIVRRTGGLADTIIDVDQDPERGNGFVFHHPKADELLKAVDRARKLFEDRHGFERIQKHAMGCHFTWEHSAKEYLKLYREMMLS